MLLLPSQPCFPQVVLFVYTTFIVMVSPEVLKPSMSFTSLKANFFKIPVNVYFYLFLLSENVFKYCDLQSC